MEYCPEYTPISDSTLRFRIALFDFEELFLDQQKNLNFLVIH